MERIGLGIGGHELDIADARLRGSLAGLLEQGRGDVDAQGCARWCHSLGRVESGGAVAAAHIEHPFTGLERRRVEHDVTERAVDRFDAVGFAQIELGGLVGPVLVWGGA